MRKKVPAYLVKSPSKKLLAVAAVLACTHAWADNWPLSLSLSETLSRDNNLYRAEPGQYAIADTVSSTGLKLGLDKSYSRQRYYASLGTALNRYIDSTQLNNTSYDFNFAATSEFTDKGLIQLSGVATQNLARFDVANGDIISQSKNIQNTSRISGQMSYGGYGGLNPYAGISHFQQGFTYTNSNYQAMNQNTYSLGTYYKYVPQLNLGFGARLTRGDLNYDQGNGDILIDETRRRDIDFSANWVVSGLSNLYARISATRSKDEYKNAIGGIQETKTRGATGELSWNYTPQGRLEYMLGFTRDNGNAGKNYDISNTEVGAGVTYAEAGGQAYQKNENNRLANTLNGKVTWDLSYKLKLNAAFTYTKYHLYRNIDTTIIAGDDSVVQPESLESQKSRYTEYSIGGKYEYARWLDLYCEIKRLKRTEDAEYRPYNATVTSCTGQFNINGMN